MKHEKSCIKTFIGIRIQAEQGIMMMQRSRRKRKKSLGAALKCMFPAFVMVSFMAGTACDQGLSPPEIVPGTREFPIAPLGGDLVGRWLPADENPVELTILDDSEFAALIDSLIFGVMLEGNFQFDENTCDINAVMTINPKVSARAISALRDWVSNRITKQVIRQAEARIRMPQECFFQAKIMMLKATGKIKTILPANTFGLTVSATSSVNRW